MAGVDRTQSPRERSLTRATQLPGPSRSRVSVCLDTQNRYSLLIDSRLIDQHDGNFIANRIQPVAGNTPQPAAIGLQFHLRPAGGANQDLEEFGAYSHLYEALVYQVAAISSIRAGYSGSE